MQSAINLGTIMKSRFLLSLPNPIFQFSVLPIEPKIEAVILINSGVKTEENGVTKSEFHYGKFQRVIPLPARIQNTQVQAEYKDGILNLTLPKSEEEKNKVVKVNLEQAA